MPAILNYCSYFTEGLIMEEKNKILIIGTGKSGIAAAKLALSLGAEVLLYNSDPDTDVIKILENFSDTDTLEIVTGSLYAGHLRGVSVAVVSPGVPLDAECIYLIRKAGIPLIGELEMGYQASHGDIIAITGTNGKTTTTSMVGAIMKKAGKDVHVAGNIGNPFSTEALLTTNQSVNVLEVSSFMLETINRFHPTVSAILNITPDHLDRHKSMENYIRCKEMITCNQTEDDTVVLNYEDQILREFGENRKLRPGVVWFSTGDEPEGEAVFLKNEAIYVKMNSKSTKLLNVRDLKVIGKHNIENACAAAAVALKAGIPEKTVAAALKEFKAVEHRIEFVRERCGVRYYNDSKGTNPDAAIQALKAMPGPTLLIGGGYDKEAEFDEWVRCFPGRVKYLILIGQTRDKIAKACKKFGFQDIMYADDLNEAVSICASYADEGDYVLLSPACASWDMFKNYEERGKQFKELVNGL